MRGDHAAGTWRRLGALAAAALAAGGPVAPPTQPREPGEARAEADLPGLAAELLAALVGAETRLLHGRVGAARVELERTRRHLRALGEVHGPSDGILTLPVRVRTRAEAPAEIAGEPPGAAPRGARGRGGSPSG